MSASLSTHVLDLAAGRPAAGMTVALWRIESAGGAETATTVTQFTTNADGRADAPLLTAHTARTGVYELRFHVGAYLASTDLVSTDRQPFLDVVPVRFGLDADGGHHHVPLLVSPYGYSTYRGS